MGIFDYMHVYIQNTTRLKNNKNKNTALKSLLYIVEYVLWTMVV